MTRMSISLSPENVPVIVDRKWPRTPKILLLVLIPLLLISFIWMIVITVHKDRIRTVHDANSKMAERSLRTKNSDLNFVRHHHHEMFKKGNNTNFEASFCFVQLFVPSNKILEQLDDEFELRSVRKVLELNPMPKFVILEAPIKTSNSDLDFEKVLNGFRIIVSKITISNIPVIIIPGDWTTDDNFELEHLEPIIDWYQDNFGNDHFDFFVQNVKFIVTNSMYDYGDLSELHSAAAEYDSWFSISLDDGKSSPGYQHVIILRNMLQSFDSIKNRSKDINHVMTEHFLDKVVKYEAKYILTYEGRLRSDVLESKNDEDLDDGDGNRDNNHKRDHHQPVGYYHGSTIFLSDGLDYQDYRIVWINQEDVHEQVYDTYQDEDDNKEL